MSVATIKIISFSSQMITSFPCLRASQFWRQWQILFPPLLWIAPAPGRYLAPEDGSPSGGELLGGWQASSGLAADEYLCSGRSRSRLSEQNTQQEEEGERSVCWRTASVEVGISAHCGSWSLIQCLGDFGGWQSICDLRDYKWRFENVSTPCSHACPWTNFSRWVFTFLPLGRYLPVALTFETATQ